MKKVALLVMVMALAVAGLSFAQAKPDFSGTWALDAAKSDQMGARQGGGAAAAPAPIMIKQTATELTQEQKRGENTITTVYKLDGTESVNKTQRGESKSTAKFDGAKLVIKIVSEGANGPMETTSTWSLSADGKELTMLRTTQRGEMKQVYAKQ
jgi:hypothetical protein